MASQGPLFPASASSIANAGTSENAEAWVNPMNVGADDGTEATITAATYDSPDISQLLVARNFGFSIPTGATIDGIVVEIDRRNSAGAASDNRVQLSTSTTFGTLVGDNKAATATDWPTATAVATYGSSSDDWNAGLTASQINSSGFGVWLSVQADAANTDIQVDFIRVTVHYTETAVNVDASGGLVFGFSAAGVAVEKLSGAGGTAFPFAVASSGAERFSSSGGTTFPFSAAGAGELSLLGNGGLAFPFSVSGSGAHGAAGESVTGAGGLAFGFNSVGAGAERLYGSGGLELDFSVISTGVVYQPVVGVVGLSFSMTVQGFIDLPITMVAGDVLELRPRNKARWPWHRSGLPRR